MHALVSEASLDIGLDPAIVWACITVVVGVSCPAYPMGFLQVVVDHLEIRDEQIR